MTINICDVCQPATGNRTQLQRKTILSDQLAYYISGCVWDQSRILCVPERVCYTHGLSDR